ncbi:Ig-like domain repeat protein, partial [Rudaea sp.]|uniref:RCC1 domain-containing protein n=1 Tax=Rudaea sp. TaxID=2136325 RepID=UPI002ED1048D
MRSTQPLTLRMPHKRIAALILAVLGLHGPNAEASLANMSGAIQLSLAYDHSCVLLSNHDVQCWGSVNANTYLSSVTVSALHDAEMIATGQGFTCALINGGYVKCFGTNALGQLGNGASDDSALPVDVTGIATATSIIANGTHACALLSDQTAKCWGDNSQGQLGHGSTTYSATPVAVDGLTSAVAMAATLYQTCAVLSSGSVSCWGTNYSSANLPPHLVDGITTAVSITAASDEMCVVLADRTARCWGEDNYGQLGDGVRSNGSATPVVVAGVSNITSIAPGGEQTCALVDGGSVYCWGFNGLGQLGDGTTNDSLTPTTVQGLSGVISIAATEYLSCALLQGGAVKCWGSNTRGQLGIGEDPSVGLPAPVPQIEASAIAAGGAHTCALISGGKVMCWGGNYSGALGDGTYTNRPNPVAVVGLSNATAISSGKAQSADHTCALLINGDVDCWGFNGDGELGNGLSTNSFLPTRVSNVQGAVAISAGGAGYGAETCALLGSGTAQCWGANYYGQLGNGGTTTNLAPTAVKGLNDVAAVSAGGAHACALLNDSTVDCWGFNLYGQTGSPPSDFPRNHQTLFPTNVSGLSGVTSIVAGGAHSCAVLADQSVKCWGLNHQGQLGRTGPFDSYQPLTVPDLTGVVAIASAGLEYDDFTCALLSGGTVRCWGGNGYGQLGDGTLNNSAFPVDVLDVNHASAISVGEHHACALLQSGQILCWGGNETSQLGRSTPSFSATPINVRTSGRSTEPAIATVVSSPNPSTVGGLVTVTATIAGKSPSGTVTFKDGDVVICADVAMSDGSAACSTSALTVGLHAITATYGGDANNAAVTSAVLTHLVYASFVALQPSRLLDTRAGFSTTDGQFAGIGAATEGGVVDLTVAGRGGVPNTGAVAVVLNVTVTNPTALGYITAWPSGTTQPNVSNLNFTPGKTIANLVVAK